MEREASETRRTGRSRPTALSALAERIAVMTEALVSIEARGTGKSTGAIGMEEVAIETLGAGGGI